MMDFCLPFGIPSQKGGVLCSVFAFRGSLFILVGACGVQIVSRCFTLYFTFLALAMFFFYGIFMLGGVLYVSCFKLLIDLYL